MGLMESLQYLIDLCISMQKQLDIVISFMGSFSGFSSNMVDLAGLDVAAAEKNLQILQQYNVKFSEVIEDLEKISGNIQVLFWLLVGLCVSVLFIMFAIVALTIYENRQKIIEFLRGVFKHEKKDSD